LVAKSLSKERNREMSLPRDKDADIIKPGSLRITTASGFAAAVVVLAAGIDPVFEALFGKNVEDAALTNEKTAIIIAAIVGWAIIAAVDMIVRSYATASSRPTVTSVPAGVSATLTTGIDESGYLVAAARFSPAAEADKQTEFLLVKAGKPPTWVTGTDIVIN
jgi:hypothetical protein